MEFLSTFNYLVWTIGNLWSTYGTQFFLGVEVHISLLQWRYIFPSSQSKKSGTTFGNCWSRKRPQARWMRMRPSRRRHESYWRPWRTVGIWDPSRRMGFLTYETRGVTEGPRARKELGGAKGDLGNWDLCEFRAMINTKNPKGSCSYWVGAPVPNSVGPQGGIFNRRGRKPGGASLNLCIFS